jgi:peptidoglycan hydrolase CwlO-like protein
MTEACPICGEPVDEDEDDPHGHFDTTNVPRKFDGDPAEAEAHLRRASDALSALEDELAIAEARAEAIEEEAPATPEEEADVTQRMEVVQREIEDLQQDIASEETHVRNTIAFWEDQGYLT